MEIAEFRRLREKLECEIRDATNDFMVKTDCVVNSINMDYIDVTSWGERKKVQISYVRLDTVI